ncbi:MAG: hypothetical protein ACYCTL_02860 [Acidimicrobiales bacterium]
MPASGRAHLDWLIAFELGQVLGRRSAQPNETSELLRTSKAQLLARLLDPGVLEMVTRSIRAEGTEPRTRHARRPSAELPAIGRVANELANAISQTSREAFELGYRGEVLIGRAERSEAASENDPDIRLFVDTLHAHGLTFVSPGLASYLTTVLSAWQEERCSPLHDVLPALELLVVFVESSLAGSPSTVATINELLDQARPGTAASRRKIAAVLGGDVMPREGPLSWRLTPAL